MVSIEIRRDVGQYATHVRGLLVIANEEFVPPLSGRGGTTQRPGLDQPRGGGLDAYLEESLAQSFVLARDGDEVVGFLSFKEGYARRMYETLLTEAPPEVRRPYVTTRTWSTNERHRDLLEELGFEEITRIEDDRGDGIDTVYYGVAVDAVE